jgi:hypothetical protein
MSNAPVHARPAVAKRQRRWRRWTILGAVVTVAASLGAYAYLEVTSSRDLFDAIADADRLDPGWRFEDIEAARPKVPDGENSALLVAAAHATIPKAFLASPPDGVPTILERLMEWPSEQPLDEPHLIELRAELAKADAALATARDLADRPRGRWAVLWNSDLLIATLMPHIEQPRRVAQLLVLDAIAASADGNGDGALRSCRAALNAGRSMGDEPTGIAQLVRVACALDAVRALERVLAQGEASEPALNAMQRLLEDEAAAPILLIRARAYRAMWFQALDAMRTGHYNRSAMMIMPSRLGERFDVQVERMYARGAEPADLRHTTAVVEIVKLPPQDQEEHLRKLVVPTQKLPPLLEGLSGSGTLDWAKTAQGCHRAQAILRCAEAALAAERYRLAEHRWPDDLYALMPRYLAAVPADPFDGRPLRLRPLPDGIVIYSVGPDRRDDGGKLDRKNAEAANTDIGFQLWDAGRRAAHLARD